MRDDVDPSSGVTSSQGHLFVRLPVAISLTCACSRSSSVRACSTVRRSQPPDRKVVVVADPASGDPQRHERIGSPAQLRVHRQAKPRRHDAHHRKDSAVEREAAAQHRGIGVQSFAPEAVADHW